MMPANWIPQNYNQQQPNILQQIAQMRKQQVGGEQVGGGIPQIAPIQLPQASAPQSGGISDGIQAISKFLGYQPNTTFGYNMSGMAQQPESRSDPVIPLNGQQTMQAPQSMNLQDALKGQNIMGYLSSIFGG